MYYQRNAREREEGGSGEDGEDEMEGHIKD